MKLANLYPTSPNMRLIGEVCDRLGKTFLTTVPSKAWGRGFFRNADFFPYISCQGMTSLDLCLQLIPSGQGNQPRRSSRHQMALPLPAIFGEKLEATDARWRWMECSISYLMSSKAHTQQINKYMNKHNIVNLKCPCFLVRYPNLDIPSQALFNHHRASALPLRCGSEDDKNFQNPTGHSRRPFRRRRYCIIFGLTQCDITCW